MGRCYTFLSLSLVILSLTACSTGASTRQDHVWGQSPEDSLDTTRDQAQDWVAQGYPESYQPDLQPYQATGNWTGASQEASPSASWAQMIHNSKYQADSSGQVHSPGQVGAVSPNLYQEAQNQMDSWAHDLEGAFSDRD